MLDYVKTALRVSNDVFNDELLEYIAAGIADMRHAGVVCDASPVTVDDTLTDYLIDDPLIRTAVMTYVRLRFGSPADYDRLKAAYDEQKGQLRESTGYGLTEVY